jgi:prophage antirepressor-like protein
METTLEVFRYKGASVRTVERDGEVWFVAKDVCDVLELTNPTMAIQELDEDERSKYYLGRQGEANVINEPGLYALVLKSRKAEAKDFSRWVRHEVLPAIRKHGGYLTPAKMEEALLNPDVIIRLAQELKAEREKVKALEAEAEAVKPKVIFADAVDTSKSSILIGNMAKVLKQNGVEIGQNRLFEWLREHGYLMNCKGERWNYPTQLSLERGLLEVKTRVINNPDGSTRITHTTKVTGKGQIYFVNMFLKGEGK